MFEIADVEKVGNLSGSSAVRFLTKSGLDRAYLRQIWELSDTQKTHALGIVEFQRALRYVSLAQNGHPPSSTVLTETAEPILGMFVQRIHFVNFDRTVKNTNQTDVCI